MVRLFSFEMIMLGRRFYLCALYVVNDKNTRYVEEMESVLR
jgi:hypothetical protein